jgi:hypothetical protein
MVLFYCIYYFVVPEKFQKIVFNCSSFEATGAVLKGSPKADCSHINGRPKATEVDSSPLMSAAANFQFTANVSLLLTVTSLQTPSPEPISLCPPP